jgi:hypothetical protein
VNFLSHGFRYLDQPYVVAGTAVPDWLSMVDRKIRARSKNAMPLIQSDDIATREVAMGIMYHHRDDLWFHSSQLFAETMMRFSIELRDELPGDEGFRPSFLGHILVEILMDSTLIGRDPTLADRYYAVVQSVSAAKVQDIVNQVAKSSTTGLAPVIFRFANARFLYDYRNDDKLLMRLNQIMARVGLPLLPRSLIPWLRNARCLIDSRCDALLTPP